jgi:dolichyl-phosphate-mannose-protein mannosyltransferase
MHGIQDHKIGLGYDVESISGTFLINRDNFRGKDHRQVYLIGNAIVWWLSSLSIFVYIAVKGISVLRWQRGFKDYNNRISLFNVFDWLANWRRYDWTIGVVSFGWFLHYFPFFLMKRQLFLHHYFPALYFSILAFCQGWDYLTTVTLFKTRPQRTTQFTLLLVLVIVAVFSVYQPVAYAGKWTKSLCERSKILNTWDFDCNQFYQNVFLFMNLLI